MFLLEIDVDGTGREGTGVLRFQSEPTARAILAKHGFRSIAKDYDCWPWFKMVRGMTVSAIPWELCPPAIDGREGLEALDGLVAELKRKETQ